MERRAKLDEFLPQADFVDFSEMTMKLRLIKSSEEHDLIRQGARICNVGGTAGIEAIAEGVPEYEVALHSTQAMIREIAKTYPHTELMNTWTWFQSGINTDGAHNPGHEQTPGKRGHSEPELLFDDFRLLSSA